MSDAGSTLRSNAIATVSRAAVAAGLAQRSAAARAGEGAGAAALAHPAMRTAQAAPTRIEWCMGIAESNSGAGGGRRRVVPYRHAFRRRAELARLRNHPDLLPVRAWRRRRPPPLHAHEHRLLPLRPGRPP